uniref:Short-chain dehydrogenase/reductase 3 n=1 Tax=Parastrongyloides trichosuri TaxID=131310 RepID=A0A0N4ZSI6_PARTI
MSRKKEESNLINLLIIFPTLLYLILIGIINALIPNSWKPKKDVKGKVVLITGAGQGLGRLYALQFANLKSNLILWDINRENLKKVSKECEMKNVNVSYQVVDVSDKEEIYKAANKVLKDKGCVDILINNAGILFGKEFLESSDENFEKMMKVNTFSHWYTLKAFLPDMIRRRKGHIVSMCSISSFAGTPWGVDYATSKFGTIGIMESIRNELKMKNIFEIKTTIIAPTFTRTAMIDNFKISKGRESLAPEDVVSQAMEAILTEQSILIMPKLLYFLYYLKGILPTAAYDHIIINSLT